MVDRQFEQMDREFAAMQRQMDRDMEAAFSRAREVERQADADVRRALADSDARLRSALREELRPAPGLDIERSAEGRSLNGSYRYYERIQISGGGSGRAVVVAPTAATSLVAQAPPAASLSPLLVGALVTFGGFLTLTAAFNRNYHLTSYAEQKRWLLLALWPLLLLFSPKFREQFNAAIRGQKAGFKREGAGGGAGGDGNR